MQPLAAARSQLKTSNHPERRDKVSTLAHVVFLQILLDPERLPARGALEGLFSGVEPQM